MYVDDADNSVDPCFSCDTMDFPQVELDLPNREDLALFSLALPKQLVPSRFLSMHNAQTITMREIILDLNWDCLVGPSPVEERFLLIVEKNFEGTRLNDLLEKFGLELAVVNAGVTWEHLAACLNYTIPLRLAPEWNKVGSRLLQGKHFLQNYHNRTASVELEVKRHIHNLRPYLMLRATEVKFPVVTLEQVLMDRRAIAQFRGNSRWIIPDSQVKRMWVRVLPTMNKGEIVGVTRQFKQDSVFSCYEDLCNYWEKMYGYVLPRREDWEDFFFFEVVFRRIGPNSFTYPSFCVLSSEEEKRSASQPDDVLRRFCTDLMLKMPTVCGKDMAISGPASIMPSVKSVIEKAKPSPLSERKVRNLFDYGYKKGSEKFPPPREPKREMMTQKKPVSPLGIRQWMKPVNSSSTRMKTMPVKAVPQVKVKAEPMEESTSCTRFPYPIVKKPKFSYPLSQLSQPTLFDRMMANCSEAQPDGSSAPPPWADKLNIREK